MKLYRIKHKPTGLYWRPSKGPRWQKRDQLNKEGKIYTMKPRLDWICSGAFTYIYHNKENLLVRYCDLEIEEIELGENKEK